MPRVTTAYVSDFQRDRVHRSDFYRGESTTYVTQFRAVIPEDDYISYVEWRCDRPDVTHLSGQVADTTSGTVTLTITNSGIGSIKTIATLASGKKVVQNHVVFCNPSSWYQGESGTIPQGPTYLRADVSPPSGTTLTLTGDAPNTTIGTPYSYTYHSSGGTQPYTSSIMGLLPDGLTFDPLTLRISGIPMTVQTSNFTITRTSADNQTANLPDTITVAQGTPQAVILADTPLLYWPLNESSGTTANDLSGNGYNGTALGAFNWTGSGIQLTSGSVSGVLLDVGTPSGSPIDVGSLPEWSIEAVFTQAARGPDNGSIATQWRSPNLGYFNAGLLTALRETTHQRIAGRMNDSTYVDTVDPTDIVIGQRVHYVTTKIAGVLYLYKNGTLVAQSDSPSVNRRSDGAGFVVGAPTSGYFSSGVIGVVQHVAVYQHGLSADRIFIHAISVGVIT